MEQDPKSVKMISVALVGKPNVGKTLLFNRMTGLRQKVSNFPGTTVQVKEGRCHNLMLFDFPGIYSLNSFTQDESISAHLFLESLKMKKVHRVLCLLDATQWTPSLRLGLEIQHICQKKQCPLVFGLNMMDELEKSHSTVNIKGLEEALQAPVIPISGRTSKGLDSLRKVLTSPLEALDPVSSSSQSFHHRALKLAEAYGPKTEVFFVKQRKWDSFFLSPILSLPLFALTMLFFFQSIFTFALPFMEGLEWAVFSLGRASTFFLDKGGFRDFLQDALFGGLGAFIIFLPQIFFLSFILGFLEDSGYLARVAMICHKPLSFFGLSGQSFIPMLTGHACAIPALFACRNLASPRRRFMTILIVPLMGCSARLPLYSLLVLSFVPANTLFGGLIGLRGVCLFALYLFGIGSALLVSLVLSKTGLKKKQDEPFMLELPPYRIPHLRSLWSSSLQNCYQFIHKAGWVIFAVTLGVWFLGYFPTGDLQTSWLASLGWLIEPVLVPLGLDWKYGVAILTSFLAREIFVSTLGVLFGIQGEINDLSLSEKIQHSGLSLSSALALLVFYALALQCVSTLVVMKKELGEWKTPFIVFLGYLVLAYSLAILTYQISAPFLS